MVRELDPGGRLAVLLLLQGVVQHGLVVVPLRVIPTKKMKFMTTFVFFQLTGLDLNQIINNLVIIINQDYASEKHQLLQEIFYNHEHKEL